MSLIFRIKSFAKFIVNAKPASGYGIHSPFIYRFATEVVLPVKKKQINLPEIEQLIKKLSNDNRTIHVQDFGTGKSGEKKVKHILNVSSSSDKVCRLLYKIIKEFKPLNIIELGTNLGLSAASMALAYTEIQVVTIEGSQSIAEIANENFQYAGLTNIFLIKGEFEDQLIPSLKNIKKPFVAFIDGNHRYQATVKYFNDISIVADESSLVIIDDIHKSEEMEKAWKEICKKPNVTTSIDLFQLGIVFFKHGLPKVSCNILF